ncbi:MAG: tetratricopeptide repeat protein, partial [Leptolyngbyaceae cyanobacterium CAN_BIN12]|nr:tetratricopeptide repeat protein [Leptolyngbyaceae cyanobacterium CAN_BIN12]
MDAEELQRLRNNELIGLHLLERTGQGMYQLHQLLREFFAAKREQRAEADVIKQTLCRVMAAVAEQMPNSPTRSQIEQFTAVIPHLKEATTTLQPWLTDVDVITPSTRIAQFYEGQADYRQALLWYQHCRETSEDRLGADHPDTATSLNNLAGLYRSQGRYGEAEPLLQRSLQICEQQLGADHPTTASSLNNLAGLYRSQGRYSEAEPLYRRSLQIREQQLGANHPDTATSLNNLAELYRSQGRYGEAEPLYLRTLAILFNSLGQDHPNSQTVWKNFIALLTQVMQAGQTAQLSQHPLTQDLLRQMQE